MFNVLGSVFGGSSSGSSINNLGSIATRGLKGIPSAIRSVRERLQMQQENAASAVSTPAAITPGVGQVSSVQGIMPQVPLASSQATAEVSAIDGIAPQYPMATPANSAASSPVFPPATQEKAAAVFGTADERQGAVGGFKQEVKERIIKDINSL